MKKMLFVLLALLVCRTAPLPAQENDDDPRPTVYPVAILPFQERGAGAKGQGEKVSDLLFASLVVSPDLYLVEREELLKALGEQRLALAGNNPDEAVQVGQLTGAKILVTGSVIEVEPNLYVVAKIIGTENSRVLGQSVKGRATDDLGMLIEELAEKILATISEDASKLVVDKLTADDRIAALRKQLPGGNRPAVFVRITERHFGAPRAIDPAAETEVVYLLRETGFTVIDPETGAMNQADILLTGEGFSEPGGRVGELVCVKCRVEIKAVDRRTGNVIAADRQTAVVVDLTEQLAGKAALQQAAADIAQRLLPKLIGEQPEAGKKKNKKKESR